MIIIIFFINSFIFIYFVDEICVGVLDVNFGN